MSSFAPSYEPSSASPSGTAGATARRSDVPGNVAVGAGVAACWYRCHLHATRGSGVCANKLWVPMRAVDALVLEAIERQVLDAAILDEFVDAAVTLWEADQVPTAASRDAAPIPRQRLSEAWRAGR